MLRLDAHMSSSEDDSSDDSEDGHPHMHTRAVPGASTNAVMRTDGKIVKRIARGTQGLWRKIKRTAGDILMELGTTGLKTKADGTFPQMVHLAKINEQIVKKAIKTDPVVKDLHETITGILGINSSNATMHAMWYRIAYEWVHSDLKKRRLVQKSLTDGIGEPFDWNELPHNFDELVPFGYKEISGSEPKSDPQNHGTVPEYHDLLQNPSHTVPAHHGPSYGWGASGHAGYPSHGHWVPHAPHTVPGPYYPPGHPGPYYAHP